MLDSPCSPDKPGNMDLLNYMIDLLNYIGFAQLFQKLALLNYMIDLLNYKPGNMDLLNCDLSSTFSAAGWLVAFSSSEEGVSTLSYSGSLFALETSMSSSSSTPPGVPLEPLDRESETSKENILTDIRHTTTKQRI